MASLKENIKQAIADFDAIKAAIEENGVEVPYDTNTSEYGDLVRQAVALNKVDMSKIEIINGGDAFEP